MHALPFTQVRANLADALRQVELANAPTAISRRGRTAGILISVAHYAQLTGGQRGLVAQLDAWRSEYLGSLAGSEPAEAPHEDPWQDVRDPSPGREFSW